MYTFDQPLPVAGTHCLYQSNIPSIGELEIYALNLATDIKTIHQWVTQPYARYWGMQDFTPDQVYDSYLEIEEKEYHETFIGKINGKIAFLFERYLPQEDIIAKYYTVQEGDIGMHILMGPPSDTPIKNYTWHIFKSMMTFLFEDPTCLRIVVEPDVNNQKIHQLNHRIGFTYEKEIVFPHKTAQLGFCTAASFAQHIIQDSKEQERQQWELVNKRLVIKAISEFTHERIFTPQPYTFTSTPSYILKTDKDGVYYTFKAQKTDLDHWIIDENSIIKWYNNTEQTIDALQFILENVDTLGIPIAFLPTYLEEINSTLKSALYKIQHQKFSSRDLVSQDFQRIEHAMTEGHPCFIANNGRIGFTEKEFYRYAPEANQPFSLIWIAAHRSRATFTCIDDLSYEKVITKQLSTTQREKFDVLLQEQGKTVNEYLYFPVHPWQWNNKIKLDFIQEIMQEHIIYLGEGEDLYSAQQSIRTLFNQTHPKKYYTKTALSILNMGFIRGLSPYYMKSTPPITDWINRLLTQDEYLQELQFEMLAELATIGYENPYFESLGRSHFQNKMLAALWRESPYEKITPHQEVMTMAAFLHVDKDNVPLLPQIISSSGLSTEEWLMSYFNAYFLPLIHCLYRYELVFMPHGENIIMVMEDHIPIKIIMKDITEEVIVFHDQMSLPEDVQRLHTSADDEFKVLSIFTDVLDCFFRHMNGILIQHSGIDEDLFWSLLASSIYAYQEQFPEYADQYQKLDLFHPQFKRCCLNRLQLKNTKQMLDLTDPIQSLSFEGNLENPLAKFKKILPS